MPNNEVLFESLHQEYRSMVLQMCLGFMKGDSDLAKDLSQQVFINTWQALSKFKNASSHKTWIYRITVNTCLKYIRDKKDNFKIPIDDVHTVVADDPNQLSATRNQSLYLAIGQLGEVDRLIIMMILDELEYQEISAIVGISEGNLRVKIHRIKKQLKKILENE
ncbi:RNA polymerase sigma factor [Flavitalea sp.]|nr:sigma-70 family RNA polymerase sigma factor [Flavitalea sp.]